MQTALRQQEKIERYEADLDELQIRLEEQNEVVAEAAEMQEENEARAEAAELEVDELKSQLADYQQALDVQQTRAIQYTQALQALQRAKELCHLPDLTPESADEWLDTFQAKEQEATEKLLSLEQKMSVAQTAHSQFEQAYQLVVAINGPLARNEAWNVARELLRDGVNQRHLAEQVQPLRMRLNELESACVSSRKPSVCWLSSVSVRVNITISTSLRRCIRNWKRVSLRFPIRSPAPVSSA